MTWDWWQTGYQIALIRAAGDRLVAASLDDGVLMAPKSPSISASHRRAGAYAATGGNSALR